MMNPTMRYLESPDFRAGYDAAALGLPFDRLKPQAWREGWDAYHADETSSETARI